MSDTPDAPQSRRRSDQLTGPDALSGLEERAVADVRALRDECREEEGRLSFTRRMLQARLDIVRAEVARRTGAGTGGLLDSLSSILADEPQHPTLAEARVTPLYEPDTSAADEARRSDDGLLEDASLAALPDLDDTELSALAERLAEEERTASQARRRILDTLDALQADLVRRYQAAGGVDEVVADVVSKATGPQH